MRFRNAWVPMLAVALLALPALGTTYQELLPWSVVKGPAASTSHFAAVVEGQTSYHQLRTETAITRVEALNGAPATSVLLNQAGWFAASGETNMSTWYGFSVAGDYLQFAETTTDAVWRVHKSTGTIFAYVSKADILALTGLTSVQLLSPADTGPTGEMAFYEGASDAILVTAGQNAVQVLVSRDSLIAATGNSDVSGGMSYDSAGNLYWGSNTSDDMWRRNADGTISQVLTTAQILAVTGAASVGWKDILAAPDGLVYFGENTSKSVLRFDPADPANTLEVFLSEADLLAGPMASSNMISLTWYDAGARGGGLAFHTFNQTGLYWVPEPAGFVLLAVAGLLSRRR